MADLITEADLVARLQIELAELDAARFEGARRTASGWLRSATGLTEWPDVIPDDLWSWALDLASIVYENPLLLEELRVGGVSERYGTLRLRIVEILEQAASAYGSANAPQGSFPEAASWPDPPAVTGGGRTPAAYLDEWTVTT